jgi:uncharacterized protein YndB with AHSA1/START domain
MGSDQFLDVDGRPSVRVEREYPHPIDKVWQAVTMPEHLEHWFPSPVEIDLRTGGEIRFRGFAGESASGVIEVLDRPRRLTFTWGPDRLTFELAQSDRGTLFTLTHGFDDRFGAASFATGWDQCLAGLRSVLAGEAPPPSDRGIARHEELVRQFGLDQPEVTESGGRWTVRVERQLTCPAEVAWDLWFGKDRETGQQRDAPAVGEPLTPYMDPGVVLGTMTELDLHRVLAFDTSPHGGPGDHVRVVFAEGTGHGARITLTVTGSDPDERDAAAEMWGTRAIGHLAASAAEWAMAQAAR